MCSAQILQQTILRAFPAERFYGTVLSVNHDAELYESEEDNLNLSLSGKTWREITTEFVAANNDEYVLMSKEAVQAFAAAWLWRIAEDPSISNPVLNALVFHLAAYGGLPGERSGLWNNGFAALNPEQRATIHFLLECASQNASDPVAKLEIGRALVNIEANQ